MSWSIIPRKILWTFPAPVAVVQPEDRLVVRAHGPGILAWRLLPAGTAGETPLVPVGGVMAGIREHEVVLGPFDLGVDEIRFRFRCTHPRCDGRDICCRAEEHSVLVRVKGE